MPRSVLVDLLLDRIPRCKILLGKRVIRIQETTLTPSAVKLGNGSSGVADEGGATGYVTCYCEDGSDYQGSILVGADGTYSAVRKCLYQSLSLNASGDAEDEEMEDEMGEFIRMRTERVMPHQHCIVGVTQPLDPIEFEVLGNEYGEFQALRGEDYKHSIWLMPLKNHRIAWNVFFHFSEDLLQEYKDLQSCPSTPLTPTFNKHTTEGSNYSFPGQYITHSPTTTPTTLSSRRSSFDDGSWQSVSKRVHDRAQAALQDLRHVPNPLSNSQGRFGDLLDKTDPEKISRVTLEQGVFRRWFHGRTVLIGDAAHKSLPYAGQGANQAILDCIYLASKIYSLVKPATVPVSVTPTTGTKVSMPSLPPMATRLCMTRLTSTQLSLPPKSTTTTTSTPHKPTPPAKPQWRTPLTSELTSIFEQYYAERSAIAQQATWGDQGDGSDVGGPVEYNSIQALINETLECGRSSGTFSNKVEGFALQGWQTTIRPRSLRKSKQPLNCQKFTHDNRELLENVHTYVASTMGSGHPTIMIEGGQNVAPQAPFTLQDIAKTEGASKKRERAAPTFKRTAEKMATRHGTSHSLSTQSSAVIESDPGQE
ncbi:hypothetical protein BGZ95_004530 [Linnemannia exigua]|uniref:FAD-binding domain-containing protein n=1 Tax=Linnemannia exigua TaxID=604196 RepID=A0AAD4DHR3_9FUNG|nr:hypothetical protein BGZ95_004530 [Linnemannia exigua]